MSEPCYVMFIHGINTECCVSKIHRLVNEGNLYLTWSSKDALPLSQEEADQIITQSGEEYSGIFLRIVTYDELMVARTLTQ